MMKKWCIILLVLFPMILYAQIITTVAGTGGGAIYDPQQLTFDKYGNLYIPSGNKVMKFDTTGMISILAGTGTAGFSGDNGPATAAELYRPEGIATDTFGNVYIADGNNNRIRKVDISTGIITTIVGNGYGAPGSGGYSGDGGQADSAELFGPNGLCFDKYGDLFIADHSNNRIRKVDTSGIIITVVGNGGVGNAGDGGSATSAECSPAYNMCIDTFGNFYFIDIISFTIRKVDTSNVISTFAGDSTGINTYIEDEVPALGAPMGPGAIAFDENGLLTICDNANFRVRKIDNSGIIHTIAGDGNYGYSGDGGLADSAELMQPDGIAYDQCGNLYIAQVDDPCIRKVLFNPYCWPEKAPQVVANEVSIYPNPATEEINIDNITSQTSYELLNINGIIEQTGILKQGSNSVPVNGLPPGIYLLVLTDNEGFKTVHKIVKE